MPAPFLDWLAVVNAMGVVQGLFLAVIFFTIHRGNRLANRLLGFLLLSMAFLVLEIILGYTGYIRYVPALVNLEEPVGFLVGPLSYFYTLALIRPDFRLRWRRGWYHFIPFLAQAVGRLPFYLQSDVYKLQDTAGAFHQPLAKWMPAKPILWFPEHQFLVSTWLDIVTFFFITAYLGYSFRLIHRYTRQRGQSFWSPSDASLRWLTRIMALFSGFLVLATFFSFTSEDDLGDIKIATGCSLIFYSISFYLVSHLQEPVAAAGSPEALRKKYEKSALDADLANDIRQKLERYVETEKPYLNSELSMPLLAEELKVSLHHLSQVINGQLGQNFSDFINRYRIEEMKRRLTAPSYSHLKIEEIAFDTGFNSKSTFQAAFKKFTGMTPSEYRKKATERV